jgi:hypothetical protein
MSYYQSQTEIENIVRAFEACETGADDFKHAEHLVVAVWYVENLGREAALDQMRSSLMRFLNHHGVDKKVYSEAVTAFWIERVANKLSELGPEVSLVKKCNAIVESSDFGKKIYADERG